MRRACDHKPWGLLDFLLTCSVSKRRMGEAHACSHIHCATPAGCSNSSCAAERILMETSLEWEDRWQGWK